MALTPAFTISQSVDPTSFTLTDTSSGSDGAVTQRRIYLTTYTNSTLVPSGTTTSYINFPLSDGASISLVGILPVDYALAITLQWLNVSGTILYTLTQYYCFTANSLQFLYALTTMETSTVVPRITQDTTYFNNKSLFVLYIDSAENAISQGNDVYKAQYCLDLAQFMITNQSDFF